MPTVKFTESQQKAIDIRNSNVLVSAAAGSGKTAVLVERIISIVCDDEHPVDIDRLLIVTFTKAAADQMREKISAAIYEKLKENPDSAHIERQAGLVNNAQITTIDSFCLFVIKNNFNEIGLDPMFRVADENEVKLIAKDILKELLEEKYATGDKDFTECVDYFCIKGNDSVLEDLILELSDYAASFPWPFDWLNERKKDYLSLTEKNIENEKFFEYIRKSLKGRITALSERYEDAKELMDMPGGPFEYAEIFEAEEEGLGALAGIDSFLALEEALKSFSFGKLPPVKREDSDPDIRKEVQNIRNSVKKGISDILKKYYSVSFTAERDRAKITGKHISALIDLCLEFDKRCTEEKRDRHIIDFKDMEHLALNILLKKDESNIPHPSEAALEYRRHFHEIMIDEYQDSNSVQEYLLSAISGEEEGKYNRFMVGDVKQSIYKFRQARPEIFMEKYGKYKESGAEIRIDLSNNFRSRHEVTDTVNEVFRRLMSKETGGIDYNEDVALKPSAEYPDGEGFESELYIIDKGSDISNEAEFIADRIGELKKTLLVSNSDKNGLRPLKYSDIVILLRSAGGGEDDIIKTVLEEKGIPVHVTSRQGYFSATEVQTLLNMLRVINNPRQDIPLYGVMKSIFGGFREEEIAFIRAKAPSGLLWEAVLSSEDEKCRGFVTLLGKYRDMSVYMTVRELLNKITDDFHYIEYVNAMPAGAKRRANVEELMNKASAFEQMSFHGLFSFIRYIEQCEKYNVDYGEADVLSENADVVRLMTIHKSKGLEFPVVFVAGLSKQFNRQDLKENIIMDTDLGLGCRYIDVNRRTTSKGLRYNAVAEKLNLDMVSEEERLLYVALTRAKEKLIMTAGVTDKTKKALKSKERISYGDFSGAVSYYDMLSSILGGVESLRISEVSSDDLVGMEFEKGVERALLLDELEAAGVEKREKASKLRVRFNYAYPYKYLEKLYTKTTVSELKIAAMADSDEAAYHRFEDEEFKAYIPSFKREAQGISGSARGSAMHRFMELMGFSEVLKAVFSELPESYEEYREGLDDKDNEKKIEKELKKCLILWKDERKVTEEYYRAVDIVKIVLFLKDELAYRMWRAETEGNLYKEQPFVFSLPAKRVNADIPTGERVLIQGIIDAYFVEDGQIVLMDYKTDNIKAMDELWKRYSTQLDYYEEAISMLTGLPVKEKLLYSFKLGLSGTAT